MKVIERKPWSYSFTCRGCQSKLEAESSDVREGEFGSMGDYDTEFYVRCTVCGDDHIIAASKIPRDVQHLARAASNRD